MSKSVRRVQDTARKMGLDINVLRLPESTRTARDAANACGCDVAQIVKSLIFAGANSGALKLLLVSGANMVDLEKAAGQIGEPLSWADARLVRKKTGFAIGGVAPIGHLTPVETFIDIDLLNHTEVWAAAGAPNAVFDIDPKRLAELTGAKKIDLKNLPQSAPSAY